MKLTRALVLSLLAILLLAGQTLAQSASPWTCIELGNATLKEVGQSTILAEDDFGEKSPWVINKRVHGEHPDKEKILALCSSVTKDGKKILRIEPGVTAYKARNGAAQMVTIGATRVIKLPPNASGKTLTCNVRHTAKGNRQTFLIFQKKGKNIQMLRALSAVVPKEADTAVIIFRMDGAGEMLLEHAVTTLAETRMEEDIICFAMDYIDRRFYLPEEGSIPMYFMIKRQYGVRSKDVRLTFDLPEGVDFSSADRLSQKLSPNTFDITTAFHGTITRGGNYCCWRPLMLLVKSSRKLNGERLRYTMSIAGKAGETHELALHTLPVQNSPVPKTFLSGILSQWNGALTAEGAAQMAGRMKQSGFNIFHVVGISDEYVSALRQNNVAVSSNWNYIRDGYPIFPQKENPAPFLGIDGKVVRNQLCPVEVYTRGNAYREVMLPKIRETMGRLDYFFINWEVYHSDYKGCFCERCRDAFIEHSHLPAEEVRKVWPLKVVATYHDQWVKFRSWQHSQICKVLEEDMSAVRGGHFMPMLSITCFNEESQYCVQYHPDDYMKYLKWANIWGPYLHTIGLNRPYEYQPARYLQHYYAIQNTMDYVRRHGGGHLKITGLPYGSHATNADLPEAVAMETLNNFILGYHGSLVYWFHFDYRYWALMAQANAKIAACEDMVYSWPSINTVRAIPDSPYIQPKHWRPHLGNCNYCPGMRTAESALVSHGWQKGNSILVAVGNFWEKGDAFFRLSIPGLKGNYLIRTPYAPYRYLQATGEELAEGVRLHLKPLVWEFYLVEPFRKKNCVGTPMEIEKEWAACRENIRDRIAEEDALCDEMRRLFRIADYNFDETPVFTVNQTTLRETKWKRRQAMAIATPKYQAVLAPALSAQLASFKVNGKETVYQGKQSSFGKPAFWRPRTWMIEEAFRIRSIQSKADHIEVVLERPRTFGFDLTVTWRFFEAYVEESFSARNAGSKTEETVLRFHHMPMCLKNLSGATFQVGTQKFDVIQSDRFLVLKPGLLGKAANIQGGDVLFTAPELDFRLLHQAVTPLQGYYLWNNPGAEVGTFEPVFEGRKLAPGETITITQRWTPKED